MMLVEMRKNQTRWRSIVWKVMNAKMIVLTVPNWRKSLTLKQSAKIREMPI